MTAAEAAMTTCARDMPVVRPDFGLPKTIPVRLYEADRALELYRGEDQRRLDAERRADECAQVLLSVLTRSTRQPAGSSMSPGRSYSDARVLPWTPTNTRSRSGTSKTETARWRASTAT